MQKIFFKTAVAGLIVTTALALGGCNATSGTANSSSVNNQALNDPNVSAGLKHEEASFFSQSGAVACGTGAGIGALACLLLKDDHRAGCIALAAAAGCALGMGANYMMDNVRSNYATTEEQLDATAKQVQKDLDITQNLNSNAKEVLADDQKSVAKLLKDYKKGVATKSELGKKSEQLTANINYLTTQKKEAENRLSQEEQTRNAVVADAGGEDALAAADKKLLRELDNDISTLKKQIEEANSSIVAYSELQNKLAVKLS